jgi:hypothetical protein
MRLSFLLLALTLCTCVLAQEAEIHGKITNEQGEPLIGASVRVVGSVVGAVSNYDGKYKLEVPPGRIRLLYSYIGYENADTLVRITPQDRELEIDIVMREAFAETGEVIVFGRRANEQTEALRNQQSALSERTIIHADLFNKYPDITLPETIQRMPGVTITRNNGVGERVQVRGLPEQFTAISLNGQRLPIIQPEADRAGSLDIIQSNLVEEVRVIKARTTDLDADAIGGTVDFIFRQPQEKFEVMAQAGLGQNFGFDDFPGQSNGISQLAGVFNSELSDEKVYALAAGSYFRHGRGNRTQFFGYGPNDTEGTEINRTSPFDTDRLTKRTGFVGAVELRPSIYNRLRLSFNHSATDEAVRQRQLFAYRTFAGNTLVTNWEEERRLNVITLDVENNFPRTRLDYTLSYATNSEDIIDHNRSWHGFANEDLTQEQLRAATPYTAFGEGPQSQYRRASFSSQLDERVAIGGVNLTRYVNSNKTSFVRAGARLRIKERTHGQLSINQFGMFGEEIPIGTYFDLPAEPYFFPPVALDDDSLAYNADERISAFYGMYVANWSARITTSVGLRYEATALGYRNPNFAQGVVDSLDQNYNDLFPDFNLTYRIRQDRQIRLSYYEAISRPAYASLVPRSIRGGDVDMISVGNPDLEPTLSSNLGITFERYGQRDGLFEVGVYAKFLDRPTLMEASRSANGSHPILLLQPINVESARLFGVELGFYQNLGFLNPRWRFFNVNGTYNFNVLDDNDRDQLSTAFTVPGAPRQSANVSLVYSNPNTRFNVVVAANFRDRVLDRIQDGRPIYRNSLFQLDLAVDYEVVKNVSLYLRANNLTDHAYEEWIEEPNDDDALLRSRTNFGSWGVIGVRFRPE